MKKTIEIEPYISNSSYFFEQENSRAYIINEKKHAELRLDSVYADLWYVILKTQDYEKAKEYAKSKNIENDFEDFLNELAFTGLIKDSNKIIKEDTLSENIYIPREMKDDNYIKEYAEKRKWFYSNNLVDCFTFELSYKCNLACKHCYNDKDMMDKFIDLNSAKKIIDEAIEIGVNIFSFTSGECTIYPDFVKILEYIREKRKAFQLITNGISLYENEELFEKIVSLYPNSIRISLYSMNPEIHDKITGVKETQKKVISVIKKLISRNIDVGINYFQSSLNENCMNDVLKFSKEVGAAFYSSAFFIDNKKNNNSYAQITEAQIYESYKDENSPLYLLLNYKNDCFYNKELPPCGASTSLGVDPLMNVYPCGGLKYALGNLKNTSLVDIFNNELKKFKAIFKAKNLKDCNNCNYFENCSYIPCMGMYENGFLKKSDICCKITKIRMEFLKNSGISLSNINSAGNV